MSAEKDDRTRTASSHSRDDDPRADGMFRAAALVGVATLPLALIGGTLTDPATYANVNPGSSDAQLLDVLIDSRAQHLWASTFQSLAAVTLWVFLGPLWARVRHASEWLALIAVIGGVIAGAVLLFWAGVSLVAAVAADYEDAGAARFLMVAGWETARVSVAPSLVMVGATTLAGMRYGVFGARVNAFGAVFFWLLLLGLVPASPAGLMGLVSTLWVLVLALVLAFANPHIVHARRGPVRPPDELCPWPRRVWSALP